MYINYLNKELFYGASSASGVTNACNIDFDPDPIGSCAKYSNEEYTEMRKEYWKSIETKYKNSDTSDDCKTELKKKIEDNIKQSSNDAERYNNEINKELEHVTDDQLMLIKNKKKMEELQTNIIASEQRLSDSKKHNYRNKVKLIIFIIAIIVFVLIELILILV